METILFIFIHFCTLLLILYTELLVIYERQQKNVFCNTVLVLLFDFNIEYVDLLDIEVDDGPFYPSF